ncbi:MAG: helix-turn-helix transcriptional regulator [Lachnospiraceae bacterium]|nr:helix-turn-helix transcriptional regulator [Lachnospiraceae bacterium]
MTYAYDEVYIEKAQTALGGMLDYAIYDLGYALSDFWNLFLFSGVAEQFGEGDFRLTVGKSGVEIALLVLENTGISDKLIEPKYTSNRSEEYWTGWALAWYQWNRNFPFKRVTELVPIDDIREMYYPYHEMDIRQFADRMDEKIRELSKTSRLKQLRSQAGLSQRELSDRSGVPLRTLQQYEQKQKDIRKAQTRYTVNLSKVLGCNIYDILELI